MNEKTKSTAVPTPQDVLLAADAKRKTLPVWLVRDGKASEDLAGLPAEQRQWLEAVSFKASARRHALIPGAAGGLAGAVLGIGKAEEPRRPYPLETLVGLLPTTLPGGAWHLASSAGNAELAAVAWGLGAYKFRRYKSGESEPLAALKMPKGVDLERVTNTVEAVWLGRDLINTPANDMGPEELEAAARALGKRHGAKVTSVVGDDLLKKNFPLIHAVGRASPRAPRLIDLTWGPAEAPKVTIVGKGICFDTGGLDIKPSSGMLLMKKDMGGAANVLGLASMIMAAGLKVRLRVLIPAVENAISGNAFRPGDVLKSRKGVTVEIGNTDAEGRLVLADALALADEEQPGLIVDMATLTGAARVALGADLPPFYTPDDRLAADLTEAALAAADPLWRMPLWAPYDSKLSSRVADLNNVTTDGFAGSITAALFLKRFVEKTASWAHFDIYAWSPSERPHCPVGGEAQGIRALEELLAGRYGG